MAMLSPHPSHPSPGLLAALAVLDVDDLEGTFVLLTVHDGAHAPVVSAARGHALLPHLELLHLVNLAGAQVELDGVVHLSRRQGWGGQLQYTVAMTTNG